MTSYKKTPAPTSTPATPATPAPTDVPTEEEIIAMIDPSAAKKTKKVLVSLDLFEVFGGLTLEDKTAILSDEETKGIVETFLKKLAKKDPEMFTKLIISTVERKGYDPAAEHLAKGVLLSKAMKCAIKKVHDEKSSDEKLTA